MTQINDTELKKAALFIAKLLLRTREGKIQWADTSTVLSIATRSARFSAKLEDDIEATISRGDKSLDFTLTGPPAVKIPLAPVSDFFGISNSNEILSITLSDTFAKGERTTPESIVYRDLDELMQLARNPKSVSDDLRLKQAMSYLDKLAG